MSLHSWRPSVVVPAGFSTAEAIQLGLCEALTALRADRPEVAVQALRGIRPLAAGAGPLPHAAVLVREAQARIAQCDAAPSPSEAASRAVQAFAAAAACLRRLAQAGAQGSTLEARAVGLRGEAVSRLEALTLGVAC